MFLNQKKEKKSILKFKRTVWNEDNFKNLILVWACLRFLIFKEKTAPTGLVSRATKTGGWNAGVKGRKVRLDLVKSVVIL